MKTIFENEYGVSCVRMEKGEDFPGTKGITNKKGYYIYSPNQGQSWTYLGIIPPTDGWLEERYGNNLIQLKKKGGK